MLNVLEVFKVNTGNPRFINVPSKAIGLMSAKVQSKLLAQIAYETGGKVIDFNQPYLVFYSNTRAEQVARRLNVIAAGGRCKY